MSNFYQNKYRVQTVRAHWWNYTNANFYFITICTKHKEHYFGKIENGIIHLSEIGNIVQQEWLKTPHVRPDMNLVLDEFVIMPNHFHALIGIGKNQYNDGNFHTDRRDAMHGVSTERVSNSFGPQRKNLASIIRGFKSSVTIQARMLNADFSWQSRFHDHIVRDDDSHRIISNYIHNNPLNWNNDVFNERIGEMGTQF